MSSQQSLRKIINNFLCGHLYLRNRWSQISVVCIWILCLVSVEVIAAPCNGNKGDNCSPDCNVSCIAVACTNGTGECQQSTTEERVPITDKEDNGQPAPVLNCELGAEECNNNTTEVSRLPVPSTDEEDKTQPAPVLKCEQDTEECDNNTTEAASLSISNTDAEEDTSLERVLECDDEVDEDCEKMTTNRDIANSACPTGYYGHECKSSCSVNCATNECHHEHGYCLNGCKEDYWGSDCSLKEEDNAPAAPAPRCDEGLYGVNCSIACPVNCVGAKCDHVTGDCSSGCRNGYQGPQCAKTCPTGYYGHECKSSCSTNCATNECNHEHGYCLNGCKDDYWGSDCSLTGAFKDNPEATQDKFYLQLSAESKSVLLYILMSKYEETLEKAQLEVNRSLRLRNKLRAILGS